MKNNSKFIIIFTLIIIAIIAIAGIVIDIAIINSDMPILLKLWLLK